jgi:hypothetical protein
MPTLTVPDLDCSSKLDRFVRTVQDETSAIAIGWDNLAASCAVQWDQLPIDRNRFGRSPGTVVARHLRYMAKLARQTGVAAGMLWIDYNRYIVVPLKAASAPRWDVNR